MNTFAQTIAVMTIFGLAVFSILTIFAGKECRCKDGNECDCKK